MDQRDLGDCRRRLLSVLWERLAELEADATREAIWRSTDWNTLPTMECNSCHRQMEWHIKGRCIACHRKEAERAYQRADKLSRLIKRYPKLARGLRKRAARQVEQATSTPRPDSGGSSPSQERSL